MGSEERARLQRALGMIEAVQVMVSEKQSGVLWCAARIIETVLDGKEDTGDEQGHEREADTCGH